MEAVSPPEDCLATVAFVNELALCSRTTVCYMKLTRSSVSGFGPIRGSLYAAVTRKSCPNGGTLVIDSVAWRLAVVTLVVLEAACTTSQPGQVQIPTSTASATPAAGAFASPSLASTPTPTATAGSQPAFGVVFGSGPGGQFLTIVGSDAKIYGQVSPRNRSGGFLDIPSVSTSNTSAYYLDGDSALMRLRPGSAPEHVRDLSGTATVVSVFAVSPDDRRIAIAVLTYAAANVGSSYQRMTLYVEDLDGSHHVDLFSTSTVIEWPVGWHHGDLVIAVGVTVLPVGGRSLVPYPYFAFGGIHVVDAATGIRKASLCGGFPAVGIATPAGVLCAEGNGVGPTKVTPVPIAESDWSGKETATGMSCIYGALQPSGEEIACDTGTGGVVLNAGSQRPLPTPSTGRDPFAPLLWVGHNHLLVKSPYTGPVLLDINTGATQTVDTLVGWPVGAIPGGL